MKYILIFLGVVVIAGAVWFMTSDQLGGQSQVVTKTEDIGEPAITIVRTNEGYVPNEVTIYKGDVVLWKNESNDFHWPASNLHPTHGLYPEFDPLRPLAPGEDWKFKFDEVGEWQFHDHLRANKIGKITVVDVNEQPFDLKDGQILEEVPQE